MDYKKFYYIILFGFVVVSIFLIICLWKLDDYHNYCYIDINGNLGYSNRCKKNQCDKVDYVVNVDKYIIIDKH